MSPTLYSLALSILNQTSPYSIPVEDFKCTLNEKGGKRIIDFCSMLRQNLAHKKYESGHKNSERNNNRKIINAISTAMVDYIIEYPGAYSVVQHHRNLFRAWLEQIIQQYGDGMEFPIPEELQFENEYQSTVVLLLKELQNRSGVTKKDLQERLHLQPRQVAKDLRKLDNTLIDNPETADMSDYIPFRIGGQPVQVHVTAERNPDDPGDRNLYFKTVNSLHPIILQENLMQTGTLIQALCRNYFDGNSNISLSIATDIWYQLSTYARSRIKWVFRYDDDVMDFISDIEDDCPAGDKNLYMTERSLFQKEDFTTEDLLMYFVKVPDRRCNITIREADGRRQTLYDQSLSVHRNQDGKIIYTATGRDGEAVHILKSHIFDIEECSNYRHSGGEKSLQNDDER